MSHAVHYRDAAGDIHLEDRPSLDAALELVERLQNEDGPTEVRVFREVPIEVKTYYRVVAVSEQPDTPVADQVAEQVDEPQAAPAVEAPVAVAEPTEVTPPLAPPAPTDDASAEPVVAEVARLTPVEPPSGATIMSPPPVSAAPVEDTGEAHDAEPRGERRQLFSRG